MSQASPLVAVVIVAYGNNDTLPETFAALSAQTEPRFELIVLDNDAGGARAVDPAHVPAGARLIKAPRNLGFAEGNNVAARETRAPFLAFLNPDAFPESAWLAQLLAAAERWPHAAAFGSTQISARDPDLWDGLGDALHATGLPYRSGYGRRRKSRPATGETFSACAAAMLVRREAFDALGGFDPRFFCYSEDVDLGFRLRLAGFPTIQVGDAVVRHVGGGSSGARSAFADYHGARNRLWTFVKNMPTPLFWPLLPAHLAATLTVLCVHAAQGRWASWRGFFAGLAGLGEAWRARRSVQASRKASTRAIASALAWSPVALLRRAPVIRRAREAAST